MVHVTAFFAGILAFLYLILALNVIAGRYKHRLLLGDGGLPEMEKRIRAHANFAEWVPLCLILMAVSELNGFSRHTLIWLGTALVLGRVSHAASVLKFEPAFFYFRSIGMVATIAVLIALSVAAVF